MFRSTLIGLALEAALLELTEARGYQISAATRGVIWRALDSTLEEELACGALPGHTARISCSDGAPSGHPVEEQAATPAGNATDGYPVYRCIDGVWTIVIKDATVNLRMAEDKENGDGKYGPGPHSGELLHWSGTKRYRQI